MRHGSRPGSGSARAQYPPPGPNPVPRPTAPLLGAFLLYPPRRVGGSRFTPGVPAAAGAAVAFLIHAGLDWDWELPAVVVAGVACLAAVLLGAPVERARPLRWPARAAALSFAVALGLGAIAGTASSAEPSAALNDEAPQSGASSGLT